MHQSLLNHYFRPTLYRSGRHRKVAPADSSAHHATERAERSAKTKIFPTEAVPLAVTKARYHSRSLTRFLTLLVFIVGSSLTRVLAQQQAMYTQYMFNGLALNPAYAGSHDALSLTGLARIQWVGIEGAPNTQTFSAHSPIADRSSVGLFVIHDNIGVTNQYGVYGSYAYRIPMGKGALSMGLQVGFNNYSINLNQINTKLVDQNFMVNDGGGFLPNFGAGLFYSSERFYVGASVPQIRNNELFQGDAEDFSARQFRHYFLTAGYVFDLGPSLKLKPNFLVKAVQGAPVEYDINANLLIKEVLWLGASYRTDDAMSFLIEMLLSPQLRLGYAYDYTTSELQEFNTGSHELMLNFRFAFDKSEVLSPRYF